MEEKLNIFVEIGNRHLEEMRPLFNQFVVDRIRDLHNRIEAEDIPNSYKMALIHEIFTELTLPSIATSIELNCPKHNRKELTETVINRLKEMIDM